MPIILISVSSKKTTTLKLLNGKYENIVHTQNLMIFTNHQRQRILTVFILKRQTVIKTTRWIPYNWIKILEFLTQETIMPFEYEYELTSNGGIAGLHKL